MIPHIVEWEMPELLRKKNKYLAEISWGMKDTSTITQPPLISLAALKIFKVDGDKKFLKKIYPAIKKFNEYLLLHRDPRGNNLIGLINPDESGEDNSPRFDSVLGLPPKHTMDENFSARLKLVEHNIKSKFETLKMKNFFWVKDVPFNAIFISNLEATEEIAEILGKNEDADFFKRKSGDVKDAMRKLMLEKGVFYSTEGTDYKKNKVKTWAIFAPLFAGIATNEEAKELVNKYFLNKDEFNLPYLVPTVPLSEPSFDPKGFWRGPVWMASNWIVYKGLMKYGFFEEAQKVSDSSLKLLEKSGFREYYNPFTGEGLGANDFTWGGLVLDMVS